jgi:hypothetical protein
LAFFALEDGRLCQRQLERNVGSETAMDLGQ